MLFVFRGIRFFQLLSAAIALATGIGAVLSINAAAGDIGVIALVPAALLALAFLWAFAAALRAPTSFVAVAEDRTRIRFAGFIDTVIANDDILSARLVNWPLWGGIGIRTNFRGHVTLSTTVGEAVELELRTPVRVTIIPGIWRTRANRLTLTIRNPQKLVERFAGSESSSSSSQSAASGRKMNRRGSRTR